MITNNSEIAETARYLSTTAKKQHAWEFIHDDIGWNDRMPNINAALGVAQMENFIERLELKSKLFNLYKNNPQKKTQKRGKKMQKRWKLIHSKHSTVLVAVL